MSTRIAQSASANVSGTASAFAPNWSADALAAAVPHTLPPLHSFDFQPPANAAALHRPRRSEHRYIVQAALKPFRVYG